MLRLYRSNRLEYLTTLFERTYRLTAAENPWQPAAVIVQSKGMGRYLNRQLAASSGIAANLNFMLPAGFSWQLTGKVLPDTPKRNPFQAGVLHWRILDILQQESADTPQLAGISPYLDASAHAPYRLAGKIADIFDQYLIYRSDWLQTWESGVLSDLGPDEIWQAYLWRRLASDGTAVHRAQQHRLLLQNLRPEHLPAHLSVFGISALPPLHLELLETAAQHCEVHLFALDPAQEYWGNILAPEQIVRRGGSIPEESGHPLLAAFGKQGRDFFDALTDARQLQQDMEIYSDNPPATLLQHLQADIQALRMPEAVPVSDNDTSVRLVSAHSRLRELEILKDRLLQDLAADPSLQPDDIAVLTPHIDTYLPFIRAVFGADTDGRALPFSVSDVKVSYRQPLVQLLSKLLDIMTGRFSITDIRILFDEPQILDHFGFSESDCELLAAVWDDLEIRWGTGAAMRETFGGSGNRFTWEQARERTVLGWLLPDTDPAPLWQGILPVFGDIGRLDVEARGWQLIGTLERHYALWQTPAAVPEWVQRIRHLLNDTAGPEYAGSNAARFLEEALADWQEACALAGFSTTIDSNLAVTHLQGLLDDTRPAGFLQGGITFCNMVPMRSLPFRYICLIGLNDGEFPRTMKNPSFDLIALHPCKGDRVRRDDDRYLFLESLLSAREKLYLSFVGRDIRKNEPLAPSALLFELTDVLAAMTGVSPEAYNRTRIENHPLQPFSKTYFAEPPASVRDDYAAALNTPLPPERPFFSGSPVPADRAERPAGVSADTFVRFWRNPVRSWLSSSLQWRTPFDNNDSDGAEPFSPDRPELVYEALLQARREHRSPDETLAALAAAGRIPEGTLGEIGAENYLAQVSQLGDEWFGSPPVADLSFSYDHPDTPVAGMLGRLFRNGRILYTGSAPTFADRTALYLEHLFFCASDESPEVPRISCRLYPPQPLILHPVEAGTARELLAAWQHHYRNGQSVPLPFFSKTAWKTAEIWQQESKGAEDAADGLASPELYRRTAGIYHNSGGSGMAQSDYPEIRQVFGRDDAEPYDQPLFWQLIRDLLLPCRPELFAKA